MAGLTPVGHFANILAANASPSHETTAESSF